MVIAININTSEEYVLELNSKDMQILVEGDLSMLEQQNVCIETILNNLVLLKDDLDKKKKLSCE